MLQLPDTGMCVNFESPPSVASAQLITLNMETCVPPEPANLSDNAWLTTHTHTHTHTHIYMHAHAHSQPNSALDGKWFSKSPGSYWIRLKGIQDLTYSDLGEAATTKVHISLRHSLYSNRTWGPRENWAPNPLNKFQKTGKKKRPAVFWVFFLKFQSLMFRLPDCVIWDWHTEMGDSLLFKHLSHPFEEEIWWIAP